MVRLKIPIISSDIEVLCLFYEGKEGHEVQGVQKINQNEKDWFLQITIMFDEMKSSKGEMEKMFGEMKSSKGEMEKMFGEMKSSKGEMEKMFGEMKSPKGETEKMFENVFA